MKELKLYQGFEPLRECVVSCRKCKRLVHYRETVPAKKGFEDEPHWRRPVPGFGDHKAFLLIAGLAPSIIGGNRTGRIFTGDESGRFLIKALYEEGFANQPTSESIKDGLKLKGCYISATVKCVPPQHKPAKQEMVNCSGYFWNELYLLRDVKSILALGKFAFDAFLYIAKEQGFDTKGVHFEHGAKFTIDGLPTLYGSFHPSPQNTNTGKLTEAMFRKLLRKIKEDSR